MFPARSAMAIWGAESSALVAGPPSKEDCQLLLQLTQRMRPAPATVVNKPYEWARLVNPACPDTSTASGRKKPAAPDSAKLTCVAEQSEKMFVSGNQGPAGVVDLSTVRTPLVDALATLRAPSRVNPVMARSSACAWPAAMKPARIAPKIFIVRCDI